MMNGITTITNDKYSVIIIDEFTDDIKKAIRSRLSSICHGAANAATEHQLYSYSSTLKEFVERYNAKTESQQKGMIGELLLHVLLAEQLSQYTVNSPFFNIEERNVKKGFDVILNRKGTGELWLAEVKSGELHANKNASQTVVSLINTAQNDLYKRLNGSNATLWLNAVNSAKAAIDEYRNDRKAIIALLQKCGDAVVDHRNTSTDFNVILVGTLFGPLSDQICENSISKKHTRVVNTKYFRSVFLVAIQKETYQKVYNFLESESNT